MDTKELIRYCKQIEQLHRSCDYNGMAPFLDLISDSTISSEQLQITDIAHVLYRIVKSCPAVNVKKASKAILSKWKRLHCQTQGHSRRPKDVSTNRQTASASSLEDSNGLLVGETHIVQSEMRQPSAKSITTEPNSIQRDLDTAPANITSEPCPVRKKCIQLLQQALSPPGDLVNMDTLVTLASDIEAFAHAVHGTYMPKYKACVRSKVANLRNPLSLIHI